MNTVGDKLYQLRTKHKLTQTQMGRKLGVVRQTVSQWESNRIPIKPENVQKICEVFDLEEDYFDIPAEEIKQESDTEVVACATVETQIEEEVKQEGNLQESDLVVEEEPIAKPNGLTLKIKNMIASLVICGIFVIGALILLIMAVWESADDGMIVADEVSKSMVNFDAKNIAIILLSSVSVIAAIITVFLLIDITHKRKNNKEYR